MVNKALLALAGLVVISLFGVGVFVGMQVAGGGGIAEPADSTPTAGTPADAPTAAPTPTVTATPEPTPDPTPTATPTATPEPTPTPISTSEFDEPNISSYLAQYLNENRSEQGLDTLTTDGRTAETVNAMAQNHSETMAEEQELAHTIDGVRSEDRYEYYDLTSVCSFATTETPSDNELEAIAMTVAGQSYTEDGQQRFNENESQVARALLDEMLANDDYRERLTHPDAGRVGVGVAVTDSGEVYATVNTCA